MRRRIYFESATGPCLLSPEQARSERFSHEGLSLHTLQWGNPEHPALVLLHGGGANAHWWDHIAPFFALEHHVIALDFRGHGDSDYPEDLEVGAFNLDLEALCHHLGKEDVMIVGHSMGAQVALDHASRFPRTRKIVLIDPARGAKKRTRRVARLALSLARSYPSQAEAIERFRFVPAAEYALEPLRQHIAAHSVRQKPDGSWGFKFDGRWFGIPSRPAPDLSRIQCPCLVIRGQESRLLSAEAAIVLSHEISHTQLVETRHSGHLVLIDRPGALVERIAKLNMPAGEKTAQESN
ncbi:MAG: alpha/beta hydrolase [Myxococcota bacterium]|nr:alpha/beta hydrolase [Myxococcota bacterium]